MKVVVNDGICIAGRQDGLLKQVVDRSVTGGGTVVIGQERPHARSVEVSVHDDNAFSVGGQSQSDRGQGCGATNTPLERVEECDRAAILAAWPRRVVGSVEPSRLGPVPLHRPQAVARPLDSLRLVPSLFLPRSIRVIIARATLHNIARPVRSAGGDHRLGEATLPLVPAPRGTPKNDAQPPGQVRDQKGPPTVGLRLEQVSQGSDSVRIRIVEVAYWAVRGQQPGVHGIRPSMVIAPITAE